MACNSCAKPFSLLRREKGCPGCGFSYCSKCLNNKVFLPKINAEAKVCAKCERSPSGEIKQIAPPDAYYKRVAGMSPDHFDSIPHNSKDQEIAQRLQSLKDERSKLVASEKVTEEDIAKRLQSIKGETPLISDEELQMRLAKLKGHPTLVTTQKKLVLPAPDLRTEEEQANDLLKQYMEQTKIDSKYKEEFDDIMNDIEFRMHKLKGVSKPQPSTQNQQDIESEDEEKIVQNIIKRAKEQSLLDNSTIPDDTNNELPFCEICDEDATMRCLGCKYLFCKTCFMEHKDDDDGCDRYELYKPPNNNK
ncbi:abscission/NoCut checkpoint regulator isoform X1 [Manduca sexta]|uniref:abscission/NoCut checkpoint regulator isoform X1 n=1 Tax=Manduca sexta TaxID=7130 RepID=UPI00188E4111|nr:abscission/NoCut checkpoint regulator isoform X1 [Manduca sexta]